ncbi:MULTISPECIES: NepR family anti-sigma factor [Methylobacterium]|jgi:RNA polymerase sigma-70 factor (ECF subfamily)|uniref:NepR family anti-sigma factor n=1 Tax=Methylobacterium TaxID=407 RepID=UPI0008E661D1|nr:MULTISPECIES: NepR family anti-sigma factor [Methylobacterium]MBK3398891.1 sigma-70 family RNA polymerase sigma factor [Methylobacterium ajmalii]MBK3408048.1 sigma-70 family RNA polymerase sigma factor [Methylobacterium ajmalii]MBK3423110.1 sigma-70 family RNA polymerase sigma factor [Methylobacterium ajmalii]MBZ6414606.1 sigma-70 family RNA polymerase sigma factor [Methylobacterium sp.]SFF47753.1 RNA polymerase sigma-70 factor, ECF subfamily [Methylobacterium sp. yr596]
MTQSTPPGPPTIAAADAAQDGAPRGAAPALPPSVQEHLGERLRAHYAAVEVEAAPAAFADLLGRLELALAALGAPKKDGFRDDLLAATPSLRRFALTLTANPARADDLVQDTMLKAWQNRDRFEAGTNLSAWLFTIMRNAFYSEHRKRSREVEDSEGAYSARLTSAPNQGDRLDVQDLQAALNKLVAEQREALMLVAVGDLSYEDAAALMQCKVGTVKSRVCRARDKLAELLGYSGGELGADRLTRSVMGHAGTVSLDG